MYPPNLTADAKTGLGRWSEEILRALTQGVSRDGRALSPVMRHAYASLKPQDARAMVAYLRTLPAVSNPRIANAEPGQKPAAPYLSVVH